jgi:hypothetical protein
VNGWFAMRGDVSGDLLTYRGQVIVHDNREQLEFLCPRAKVIHVGSIPDGSYIPIRWHPQFENVQWGPNGELDRRQFRDPRH